MNLQEQIRIILKEESSIPLALRRRVSYDDIEEAFDAALERMGGSMENPDSIIYKEKEHTTLRLFAKFVIDEMVTYLEQDYFNDDNRVYFEDDDFYYDKIRKPLLKRYGKRIKEKYNEIKRGDINESILREEKEIPAYIRRRLYIADEYMDDLNTNSLPDVWVLDEIDVFVRECMGEITRMIISKTSEDISVDNYMKLYDDIYGYLIKLGYQKRLFNFFYDTIMDRDKNK